MRLHTDDLTKCVMLTVIGILLGYVENLLPLISAIPGIKIGFSNIVVLFALIDMSYRQAAAVGILKSIINGIVFTGITSMMYSLTGVIISIAVMSVIMKFFYGRSVSIVGVSISGSATFNIGQIIMCCILLKSTAPVYYLGVLLLVSVFSGLVTGILTYLVSDRLYRSKKIVQTKKK